jgi:hypothetical protein
MISIKDMDKTTIESVGLTVDPTYLIVYLQKKNL